MNDQFQCLVCLKIKHKDTRGTVRGTQINVCEGCIEKMSEAITKANVKEFKDEFNTSRGEVLSGGNEPHI